VVQTQDFGPYLGEDDIVRFKDLCGRINTNLQI
jgi:hypothetical protein